jgi:hypothetical protein
MACRYPVGLAAGRPLSYNVLRFQPFVNSGRHSYLLSFDHESQRSLSIASTRWLEFGRVTVPGKPGQPLQKSSPKCVSP